MSHEQGRKSRLSLGSNLNLHVHDKDHQESVREHQEQFSRSFIGPQTFARRDTCITLDGYNCNGTLVRPTRSSRIFRNRISRLGRFSDMLPEDVPYWFYIPFPIIVILFVISIILVWSGVSFLSSNGW